MFHRTFRDTCALELFLHTRPGIQVSMCLEKEWAQALMSKQVPMQVPTQMPTQIDYKNKH